MEGNTDISLVYTPQTPYCYVVALSEGKLRLLGPFRSEEEANVGALESPLFQGVDYQIFWSKFKYLAPTGKIGKELLKKWEDSLYQRTS